MQSSYYPIPDYVTEQMKGWLDPGWEYYHFTNDSMIEYFEANPIEWCPNIVDQFWAIQAGPHRADLFRYYWLYQNGGMYLDSDIMLTVMIDRIVQDHTFISVRSVIRNTFLNGVLAATPGHPIIEAALRDAYTVDPAQLEKDYSHFCRNLAYFIRDNGWGKDPGIRLYREREHSHGVWETYDDDGTALLLHYQLTKIIPEKNE